MASFEQVEEFESIPEGEFLPATQDGSVLPQADDDRLDFTQDIRGMVINQLMPGGKAPISDKDQMGILDKMLNGIDKQVLGKKRVAVSQDAAKDINTVAKMLEEVSKQVSHEFRGDPMKEMMKNHRPRDPNVFNIDLRHEFDDIEEDELTLERREENSEEFFRRVESTREKKTI